MTTTSTSVLCDLCKRMIGSSAGLTAHMRSMHPVEWRAHVEAQATPARGARPLASVPPPPPAPSNGFEHTGTLVWEEPPPERKGRGFALHAEISAKVVALKRRPGEWARLRSFKTTTGAGGSLSRMRTDFPDVEFVGRRVEEGEHKSAIWGRYVEPED